VTAHDTRTTGTDHGKAGFLAEASRLLAGSLDYETTLATVAGMALPHLGAWCFVDLIEPGGEMRRLAVIHPDPDKQTLARRLEGGWPPSRDDPFGVPHAMRTRESEIIREVPDDMLVEAARTEEILGMLRELGIGSLMVVPLIARDEVLGAITYVSPSGGRIYSEDDMEVAEDLAARCAVAIDNGRLYQEAERARKEAEEASQAKSLFLATMSHEIRTPINAVVGYVDLLETGIGGALSPDQVRYLERIKASNSHLLGLIDDVLDLAKADAGQIQVEQEEATMLPVVENARDMVRPQLESRTLSLSETCEGDAEARIVADVNRVRQIVVNLLSNAIKFTPDGGRIRLSCGQAHSADGKVIGEEDGPWAYIRVEDTGIGIDPESLERLFEPFTQADSGYTRSREGSGLGLAISRRLARAMGGDLTVDSRLGEGSTFTLWLPTTSAEVSRSAPEPTRDEALHTGDQVRGVRVIGERMLNELHDIAGAFVRRIREERPAADLDERSDAILQDHTLSLLADFAQSLVLLEDSASDAAELLRDGSAIQRTIADRHGLQRHRLGWKEEALETEFEILKDEVERAVRRAARDLLEADAERSLEFLEGFLDQARRGSQRAFRMAAQGKHS
jgi:signal transduction histidine kinase